jgi:hypothetical protein
MASRNVRALSCYIEGIEQRRRGTDVAAGRGGDRSVAIQKPAHEAGALGRSLSGGSLAS